MANNPDPWAYLKEFTSARIALGRSGSAVPTKELLAFKAAHAAARDAVWAKADFKAMSDSLKKLGEDCVVVTSRSTSKQEFLLNPQSGRELSDESKHKLKALPKKDHDLLLVIGDGLSSIGISEQAPSFIQEFKLCCEAINLRLGPIILAEYARVGLTDSIGSVLSSPCVVMLIGERPGLNTAASLSVYLTYKPEPGRTDAERNCISNIHSQGLEVKVAALMAAHLAKTAIIKGLSGVDLKVEYLALDSVA